ILESMSSRTELRRPQNDDDLRGEETVESCRSSDRRQEHSDEPRKVNAFSIFGVPGACLKSNKLLIFSGSADDDLMTESRCGGAAVGTRLSPHSPRPLAHPLAAVLPPRKVEPALAGAEEAALVGKAEQIGGLRQGELQAAEVLLGEFAPGTVQKLDVGCFFLLQAPLQGALAHGEFARDLVAARLAVGQPPDDHFARPVAGSRVVEVSQVLAREALVQLGKLRV